MHILNQPIIKTLYHTMFVTSSEAELFAIRCGINQAFSKKNIFKIIVSTNSIYIAKKIFDSSSYPFQIQAMAILKDICQFFSRDLYNLIEFWKCPSHLNQHLYKAVNLEIKVSNPIPVYLCKTSQDYSKKTECNNILNVWKMTFQALDEKGNQFLDLLDDSNSCVIEPSYAKEGPWLQSFRQSNSLCVHTSKAITNYTPIREYRLRFFTKEDFKSPCGVYSIESRRYILHDCKRFNSYQNLRRDTLSHFVMFLKANPNTFAFLDNSDSTSISRPYNQFYPFFSCSFLFTFCQLVLLFFSFFFFLFSSYMSAFIVCSYKYSYHSLPSCSV